MLLQLSNQMTCNLSMGRNNITQLADPVRQSDAANKSYVDSLRHKPAIAIWAERRGDLHHSNFEWSFGGNGGEPNANSGYMIMSSGRIIKDGRVSKIM